MRALIDTNVLLDVALQREPYKSDSTDTLALAESKRIAGYVSASVISDVYYIARKSIGGASALGFLEGLLKFCEVATVDRVVIDNAIEATASSEFKDFEDAIQNYTAVANALDTIVTRNAKDFVQSKQRVLTPAQLNQIAAGREER